MWQAFYKPRAVFNPALQVRFSAVFILSHLFGNGNATACTPRGIIAIVLLCLVSLVQCAKLVLSQAMGGSLGSVSVPAAAPVKEPSTSGAFFKVLSGATVGRGKDKDKDKNRAAALTAGVTIHPDSN